MSWLYVDQGNTRIKWRYKGTQGILSGVSQSISELARALQGQAVHPQGIVLASVRCDETMRAWKKAFPDSQWRLARVKPNLDGLSVAYAQPDTLGIDRWLGMLGGWQRFKGTGFAVLDAGTALTLDVVNEQGRHIGGWIAPGIKLLMQSIERGMDRVQTAQPVLELRLGDSTQTCVSTGLGAMLAGWARMAGSCLVDQGVDRVLLTGGDADMIQRIGIGNVKVENIPNLVLDGLEYAHRVGGCA